MSHWAANHWYGSEAGTGSGTATCTPPSQPTLSVNADGDIATITGSSSDATNYVEVLAAPSASGSYSWTQEASRVGDGNVALTMTGGRYWGRVTSVNECGTAVSNLVLFWVGELMLGTLLHSPADVLRHTLIALGKGSTPGSGGAWPIYTGMEPASPDDVITTYDTPGRNDGRDQNSGERFEHRGVQVRVRGANQKDGYEKANSVAVTMDEQLYDELVTIDGAQYMVHSVSRLGNILGIGREGATSSRRIWTVNCVVSLRMLG